jgi:hypothetical protein
MKYSANSLKYSISSQEIGQNQRQSNPSTGMAKQPPDIVQQSEYPNNITG